MTNKRQKKVILEVKNLKTYYTDQDDNIYRILDGINLKIYEGTTLGILGPTGVGKSVLVKSILRLVEKPGKIIDGEVIYDGLNLITIKEKIFNEIRGKEISLVSQNVPSSFDPTRDITFATSQPYRQHTADDEYTNSEVKLLVISQLGLVAVPEPVRTSDKYSHQISGGESQRVKIAAALINNPRLLLADEPVANLDATVARKILDLMHKMQEKYQLSMLFVAHNLGVLAEMSDYVAIMYAGHIIEYADVETIFYNPRHPFSQGLFYATPSMAPRGKLEPIPGIMADPKDYPKGCRFHPRCKYRIKKCVTEMPPNYELNDDHNVKCWRYLDIPKFKKEDSDF